MRLAAYAGVSTVLAVGVVLRAFIERPNFYSAAVYLGQSNACRMILLNFLLFSAASVGVALQRLLYGRLRPIEIEQLWDKAWYAITETALAMTTFRDEVGGWFLIMFTTLLAGKIWSWLGEGRVEILEQQPPANPQLFHSRLITSLIISNLFDVLMLRYCVRTLAAQPRPGMMVMFAFEFAVLVVNSISILVRYALVVNEQFVVKRQTQLKLQERRAEVRAARQAAESEAAGSENTQAMLANIEREEDVDETDIDVPGWQEKGRWMLFLDLTTDFVKLVLYIGFFIVLLLFSGIPIHMFRDLFITMRNFFKRIGDYIKYRNATRDMNTRYPDATAADLQRDGTCIVCREDMQVWQAPVAGNAARGGVDERQRPKRLPCGHILHFACLKSWLERQQVCPTCRRSVLARPEDAQPWNQDQPVQPQGQGQAPAANGAARPANPEIANFFRRRAMQDGNNGQRAGRRREPGAAAELVQAMRDGQRGAGRRAAPVRQFNLFGMRFTLAAGNARQVRNALDALNDENAAVRPTQSLQSNGSPAAIQEQIRALETQIMRQITELSLVSDQLRNVRLLQGELARLRIARANLANNTNSNVTAAHNGQPVIPTRTSTSIPTGASTASINDFTNVAVQQAASAMPTPPSHTNLPPGMTLPEGWTLMPLQRIEPSANYNWQLPNIVPPVSLQTSSQRNGQGEAISQAPSGTAQTQSMPSFSNLVPHPLAEQLADQQPAQLENGDEDSVSQHEPSPRLRRPLGVELTQATTTQGNHGLDLPNWGSEADETRQSQARQSIDDVNAKESASSTVDKGKAKAATVEDDDGGGEQIESSRRE